MIYRNLLLTTHDDLLSVADMPASPHASCPTGLAFCTDYTVLELYEDDISYHAHGLSGIYTINVVIYEIQVGKTQTKRECDCRKAYKSGRWGRLCQLHWLLGSSHVRLRDAGHT
ncbi:hypothetical protein QYE76_022395 [Lolium multiflorum]|uniref:Uncharacterized protein n=1 Tax=Lolium multiflorum TaxID=4521 RepID=A0AAD8VU33_LOLMU|nr:hypothetical protein QYE76_022395 [Lolium multiflorum]